MKFQSIYGVDFSGAKLAGRNTWVARLERGRRRYALADLSCLETLCGSAERDCALGHLVDLIAESERALWALDFPFGMPVEVFDPGTTWPKQLEFLANWTGDAYGVGLECLRRAKRLGGPMHIKRDTDRETLAPFDAYHYRIIYQLVHGMRDVLLPLARTRGTAVLPFHYRRLPRAWRVLVEACPSSTLKRWRLPHQNYKQPQGGPLLPKRIRTRHAILDGLTCHVAIGDRHRRVIMRNGGGDALDAVIAAVGGAQSWESADHRALARHPRYPREGRLFV